MHIKKWTREAAEAKDEGWIGTCDLCERHIDTYVWHCGYRNGGGAGLRTGRERWHTVTTETAKWGCEDSRTF